MTKELRPFWRKFLTFNWKFGLFLIFLVCIPRFILVLHANATANYKYIGLIMTISAIIPFIFMNKYGRKAIGLTKPQKYSWLLVAFVAGLIASLLLYLIGQTLYGNTDKNWYQYIAKSYNIPLGINKKDKAILFAIMATTAMLFSPIGEELFFRGLVHTSFAESIGEKKASWVDSSAFALTHISHFGLVFINKQWHFFTIPTLLWVLSMFLVSLLFYSFRKNVGSIIGAIVCHAAFNLGMVYCIFYL